METPLDKQFNKLSVSKQFLRTSWMTQYLQMSDEQKRDFVKQLVTYTLVLEKNCQDLMLEKIFPNP